jgi:hypothetical protein
MLFGGVTPQNGFMVMAEETSSGAAFCFINDDGPASLGGPNGVAGFQVATGVFTGVPLGLSSIFATPPGYKPMGPVSVVCGNPSINIEARAW